MKTLGSSLALVALVLLSASGALRQDDPLKAADAAFERKTYSLALKHYEEARKDPSHRKDVPRIRLRIGLCLARLSRQDEALHVLRRLGREGAANPVGVLALVEAGVMALSMPHFYYEKDGQRHRGRWVQGGVYHWTAREDLEQGLRDLEAAARRIETLLGPESRPGKNRDFLAELHQRCFLELAAAIERKRNQDGDVVPEARRLKGDSYADLGTWNERLAHVFDRAAVVQGEMGKGDGLALSRYLKAMAFRRLLQQLSGLVVENGGSIRYRRDSSGEALVALPDAWNPLKILAAAWPAARERPLGDDILYGLASVEAEVGLLVAAVGHFRQLLSGYPKSRWLDDARRRIEEITFPRLSVEAGETRLPGRPVRLAISSRNLKSLRITVRRFSHQVLFQQDRLLRNGKLDLRDSEDVLKRLRVIPARAKRVFDLEVATPDEGRHRTHRQEVSIPSLPPGSYLVEARSGELVYRDLLFVSDLALVRHVDRGRVLVFATDAHTGRPLSGVQVLVREKRWGRRLFGHGWKVRLTRGRTDSDGVFEAGHIPFGTSGTAIIEVAAWRREDAALVPGGSYWAPGKAGVSYRAYVFTDRPVYRPGDQVRLAAVLRSTVNGEVRNLPGEHVLVRIRDPRGEVIFEETLQSDASGALDQALALDEAAALGVHHISITRGKQVLGRGRFRVEEYKVPEFLVSITGAEGEMRLGGTASAVIHAGYTFGAPVSGARVRYRVSRERFRPRFRHDEPFRELYGSRHEEDPEDRPAESGELVLEGEGRLDERGRLVIRWETGRWAALDPPRDSLFIIQADVTDASRRTILGTARIPVTRASFQASLRLDQGFYFSGEKVSVEVQTLTAAGLPIAASGRLILYAVEETRTEEKTERKLTRLLDRSIATNAEGIGFGEMVMDAPGLFMISFQAPDAAGNMVRADALVWVQKEGFRALGFHFKNLDLKSDRRVYRPGETARILVTGAFPEAGVLFCVVAGHETLEHRILRLDGKTRLVEIPITDAMAPNVHLMAFSNHEGVFHQAVLEILVPPVERLLDVTLSADKTTCSPGEKTRLRIRVRDHEGRPVPARVALTVYDSALTHIQREVTEDIRRFFHGHRRSRNTSAAASAGLDFSGYLAEDVEWGEYESEGPPPLWWGQPPGLVSRMLKGLAFGSDGLGPEVAQDRGETKAGSRSGFDFAPHEGRRGATAGRARRGRSGAVRGLAAPAESAAVEAEASEASIGEGLEIRAGSAVVRSDFRDSALWAPRIRCDAEGRAEITIPFPDSLTRWRVHARAWTSDTRVGEARIPIVTSKDLMVRLQAPRFFVEGDRISIGAIVNNRTSRTMQAAVKVRVRGETLRLSDPAERSVEVPAGGSALVEWWVDVTGSGKAEITVEARSGGLADAMRKAFSVREWGARKTLTHALTLENGGEETMTFELPASRRAASTRLVVSVQPGLAATALEALPYLVAYPYGCTEQTISRFIPAVATALVLEEMGTSLEEIASARDLKADDGRAGRGTPVLSGIRLDDIIAVGLRRIASMQNRDGGFGWWKGDPSTPYLSAYVLDGLLIAGRAGHVVKRSLLERVIGFLEAQAPRLRNLHEAAFVSLALSRAGRAPMDLLDRIHESRDDLGFHGKALLASALQLAGQRKKARIVVENLEDGLVREASGTSVHWESGGPAWRWWNSPIETNVAVLQALLDVDPESPHLPGLVRWIVDNRRGRRWTNTKDTALCVLALCRYARMKGETNPEYELEVTLNGARKTFRVGKENLFTFDDRFVLEGDALVDGANFLRTSMKGRGRAHVTAALSFFTREQDIAGVGNRIQVRRTYHRLRRKVIRSREGEREVERLVFERDLLPPGASVKSGEIIEVELQLQAGNDFDYLLVEDRKPAGFEALALRSGPDRERGISSHREFRDDRTAFFVSFLQQGTHRLTYRLRAERPRRLRVLPARVESMYSPDFGGISDSFRIRVVEGEGL